VGDECVVFVRKRRSSGSYGMVDLMGKMLVLEPKLILKVYVILRSICPSLDGPSRIITILWSLARSA